MNSRNENKLGSFYRLDLLFDNKMSVLSLLMTAFPAQVGLFRDRLAILGQKEILAVLNRTAYAADKLVFRIRLIAIMMKISGAYTAYFLSLDTNEANAGKHTKSKLKKMRDTAMHFKGQSLYDLAFPLLANLEAFGLVAQDFVDLQAAVTSFKNFLEQPNEQKQQGAAAAKAVLAEFKAIEKILKVIDAMMLVIEESHPEIYNNYKGDRQTYNNASGWSTLPIYATITIPENGFIQAGVFTFHAQRSFKAKSHGTGAALWALSKVATEFTHSPRILPAKGTSVVQSSTLGDDGDILLFQNPTSSPITVDIWVIE